MHSYRLYQIQLHDVGREALGLIEFVLHLGGGGIELVVSCGLGILLQMRMDY